MARFKLNKDSKIYVDGHEILAYDFIDLNVPEGHEPVRKSLSVTGTITWRWETDRWVLDSNL